MYFIIKILPKHYSKSYFLLEKNVSYENTFKKLSMTLKIAVYWITVDKCRNLTKYVIFFLNFSTELKKNFFFNLIFSKYILSKYNRATIDNLSYFYKKTLLLKVCL